MNTRTKSGIGLILLLAFILLITQLPGPAPEQRITLKDGSVLILREVRPGIAGPMTYSDDPSLIRLARRILPVKFARKHFGYQTSVTFPSHPELLHLFFTYIAAAPTPGVSMVYQKFGGRLEVEDHQGNVRRVERNLQPFRGGTNNLFGLSTPIFPRRDKTFLLRCYDDNGTLSASFTVTNPTWQATYPEWKPEPLPATKTNGTVKLTLHECSLKNDSEARVRIKLESSDKSWLPSSSMDDLMDDGSKKVYAHQTSSYIPFGRYGNYEYWFIDVTGNKAGRLFPNEPAWKLHLRIYRDPDAAFPTNLVWRSPLILIPPAQQCTNDLHWTNLINGISVRLLAVCGGGRLFALNDICQMEATYVLGASRSSAPIHAFGVHTCDTPFVVVKLDRIFERTRTQIRLLDENGKDLFGHPESSSSRPHPEGDMSIEYLQSLRSGITGKVQVEIVINDPKEFEFLIPPAKY